MPVFLHQGCLRCHDCGQGVQLGLEPEGVLGPKTRLSQGFLGDEKRSEYGTAKTRGDPALTALGHVKNDC